MKPFIHELVNFDPLDAFRAVQDIHYSLLLDSADTDHPAGRYSFVCCNPVETIEAKNGKVVVTNWDGQISPYADPFEILKERMQTWVQETETVEGLPPFQGGAAGLFGYDLGRDIEVLPDKCKDNPTMPDMAVGIYDQVFAHDNQTGKSWLITHANSLDEARIKQKHMLRLLSLPDETPKFRSRPLDWEPNFDAYDYKQNIRKVIDYIHKGDVFQVNLAQRFDADLPERFDPFAHYLRLREVNKAPFACYMNLGHVKIASSSPERFLTVTDGYVETRPIKGTRPHVPNPALDGKYKDELKKSKKDRAENTMIVDLLRNDLSRVCRKNSVKVEALCQLETFAAVHHLVSIIRGKLLPSKTPVDLMRACFPGGSITGAPKIRAMEIIEELEPTRRGPYCGSIGYIGFDGTMDSNILIRTLVYEGRKVSLQVGSGIVADSRADEEYEETFDKAAAIFNSFEEELTLEIEDLDDVADIA